MKSKQILYRKIVIVGNNTEEPVNYVGVHPLKWSEHPSCPDVAFIEIENEELQDYIER